MILWFLSEKISRVEKTKLDDEFLEMERKIDVTHRAFIELLPKCIEYLQPNPAYRMKLGVMQTVFKITGQLKNQPYPHSEGMLGDCMLRYGSELGEESLFGQALLDCGETMMLMSDIKEALDINVKQNFLDPVQLLEAREIKDIERNLRKLESRRLDYDYIKRRDISIIHPEELQVAGGKFEESKELVRTSMTNFLENDIEQVNQLAVFIEALLEYHRQNTEILEDLYRKLHHRIRLSPYYYKSHADFLKTYKVKGNDRVEYRSSANSGPSFANVVPCCRGLYDFAAEHEEELGFKEGDIITITSQVDENWYAGILEGKYGFFPITYVEVLVPLPSHLSY
ncbi:endophilin-A3 isoform X2 [Monodelphis domestica]|uniref:SH3 domain containing GRB2 like 3, endophilin A3 n=1 Tax=Monodelphis domestica TaxID=13616 RepID=A0A5F8H9K1_MONDO|nr:endophilin-A3 isoform X2 [Monodelphis domestica]